MAVDEMLQLLVDLVELAAKFLNQIAEIIRFVPFL
jgi:hypothetical protein